MRENTYFCSVSIPFITNETDRSRISSGTVSVQVTRAVTGKAIPVIPRLGEAAWIHGNPNAFDCNWGEDGEIEIENEGKGGITVSDLEMEGK